MIKTLKRPSAVEKEPHVQLELALDSACSPVKPRTPAGRIARARWWFREMHRAVDAALDWGTRPPGRPEQGRLDLSPGLCEPLP